jgi:hypothetical protein
MRMPKKNEHRDVFLRVRIYEKCSSHNHKTIKQHSKQTNTPRPIPSVIIILQTNTMTIVGKLAIKLPFASGRFVIVVRLRPRTFTNLPSASGNLIANFPLVMLLLIIKHDNECFNEYLKYDYKRCRLISILNIRILIRMNNYTMPHVFYQIYVTPRDILWLT